MAKFLWALLTLVFCSPIDTVALSIYATELVMWALVLLCGSFMRASSKLNVSPLGPEAILLEAQTEGQYTPTLRSRRECCIRVRCAEAHASRKVVPGSLILGFQHCWPKDDVATWG